MNRSRNASTSSGEGRRSVAVAQPGHADTGRIRRGGQARHRRNREPCCARARKVMTLSARRRFRPPCYFEQLLALHDEVHHSREQQPHRFRQTVEPVVVAGARAHNQPGRVLVNFMERERPRDDELAVWRRPAQHEPVCRLVLEQHEPVAAPGQRRKDGARQKDSVNPAESFRRCAARRCPGCRSCTSPRDRRPSVRSRATTHGDYSAR